MKFSLFFFFRYELTIVGTNGGLTFLSSKSSHRMCLKNACFFTSSASRSDEPSLRSGFLRSNCKWTFNDYDNCFDRKKTFFIFKSKLKSRIIVTHSTHNCNGFQWQETWIADFVINNRIENFFFVISGERWLNLLREKKTKFIKLIPFYNHGMPIE